MYLADQTSCEIETRSKCLRDVKSSYRIFLTDLANGGLALSAWIKVSIFGEFWLSKCYYFLDSHYFNLFSIFVFHVISRVIFSHV